MDTHELHEGMLMMKNGRVLVVRQGELTPIEEEVVLPDGTRVMPDGTVQMTDGKTRRLADNETMRKFGLSADQLSSDQTEMPDIESEEEMTDTETHDPS